MFIPQEAIDAWVASDRVEVAGDMLQIRPGGGALKLQPASLFCKVAAGSDHGLVGKVKGEEDIAALGGEAYMTSVILGETAYEVEPGFLGTPVPGMPAAALLVALRALTT